MENSETFIVCQNCGESNEEANNFCKKCANPLKTTSQQPTNPKPPQSPQTTVQTTHQAPPKKNKGCLTAFLVVAGIVILLGIIGALSNNDEGNTKDSTTNTVAVQGSAGTTEAPTPYEITVDALVDALNENALSAAENFKGKYVKVTGKLSVIDSSGKYFSIAPMDKEWSLDSVMCYIKSEQKQTVAQLKKGQKVTVIGTITQVGEVMGYSLDVKSIE
ncbi:MAG TPA: hypothetical protein VFD25_00435 [Clostridia bacterium]|nr:hypothetical protein [Clostridia bacterium]